MVEQKSLQEFLEALSSKQPVPGGGGASALGGAMGNALGQMVVNLTVGKKKYQAVEAKMQEYLAALGTMHQEFIRLADEDARVFAPLAAAYGLPASTEDERAYKDKVMEENLLAASLVPLDMMKLSMELLEILKELAEKGSRLAVSDVGVAVQFTRTALLGAVMNVYINTKSMKNRQKAEELNQLAESMISAGTQQADAIYQIVLDGLK